MCTGCRANFPSPHFPATTNCCAALCCAVLCCGAGCMRRWSQQKSWMNVQQHLAVVRSISYNTRSEHTPTGSLSDVLQRMPLVASWWMWLAVCCLLLSMPVWVGPVFTPRAECTPQTLNSSCVVQEPPACRQHHPCAVCWCWQHALQPSITSHQPHSQRSII